MKSQWRSVITSFGSELLCRCLRMGSGLFFSQAIETPCSGDWSLTAHLPPQLPSLIASGAANSGVCAVTSLLSASWPGWLFQFCVLFTLRCGRKRWTEYFNAFTRKCWLCQEIRPVGVGKQLLDTKLLHGYAGNGEKSRLRSCPWGCGPLPLPKISWQLNCVQTRFVFEAGVLCLNGAGISSWWWLHCCWPRVSSASWKGNASWIQRAEPLSSHCHKSQLVSNTKTRTRRARVQLDF